MGAVGIILGMLIAVGSDITDYLTQLLLGCLTVIFFIIGGNTLNDYLDRDLDKFAHPERPLPSGKIKPQVALTFPSLLSSLPVPFLCFWARFPS